MKSEELKGVVIEAKRRAGNPRIVSAGHLALDIELRRQQHRRAKLDAEIADMEAELEDYRRARANVATWIKELELAIAVVPQEPSTEYDA